ncbi:MAG: HipA family kinase, partial [Thermoactinomyces sp.]
GSRKVIPKCTNLHEMPLVIVFDHWINNNDRYDHSANYIVDLNDWKIHLIDHSSCFYGTKWKIRKLNEIKSHIKVYWGKVYQRFVPFIDRDHPFDDALSTLEPLSRVQIEEAVSGVPSEWGVSDDELRVLVDFLIERKSHVSKAIQQLKPYFPIWWSTTRKFT